MLLIPNSFCTHTQVGEGERGGKKKKGKNKNILYSAQWEVDQRGHYELSAGLAILSSRGERKKKTVGDLQGHRPAIISFVTFYIIAVTAEIKRKGKGRKGEGQEWNSHFFFLAEYVIYFLYAASAQHLYLWRLEDNGEGKKGKKGEWENIFLIS